MSLAKLHSRALRGTSAPSVIVEVHVSGGLPSFAIVGLPDTEVKESRDRVRSAITTSGYNFPARRITVNLAPADLPKDSGRYDLPIALGVLIASGLVKPKLDVDKFEFTGELALDGSLRETKGALAIAYNARENLRSFIVPKGNADEAALVEGVLVYAFDSLNQVIQYICGERDAVAAQNSLRLDEESELDYIIDFNQVKGQIGVKFALEVAAAGRHSLLMVGNPGCGKSMLAERIKTILPPLTNEEAIESASIYSLAKADFDIKNWNKIPFRRPHHSSSATAIVGGSSNPKPGEISLAHKGVLFMDELPEFERKVLEMLREPLETKKINIARANNKVEFPADFQLIGAMNPCPCGNSGHPKNVCRCSPDQISRYMAKISAPLLDRIDLVVQMPYLQPSELQILPNGENSKTIRKRVISAREKQLKRQGKLNYELENDEVEKYCELDGRAKELLTQLIDKFGLSARGYYRILKVARTIADLANDNIVRVKHISQAAQYRKLFD